MIERHGLGSEALVVDEVHEDVARFEKRSRHQAPTALRIPLVASLADDLVGEVAEPLAGGQRAAPALSSRPSRVSDTTPCHGR